jgi:recombination protein RecT
MNAIAKTQVEAFQAGFAATIPQIKAVLPTHIPFEKFERVAMMAVQLEPKLLQCEMKSLFLELQKCAADGLLPDRKEAVITYRYNSKKGCNIAVYQPMIAGVKKLARNSGEVSSFTAQNVYEGEPFKIILGDDERIEHERKLECINDDKIIGAYAVVKLKDGSIIREFMSIAEIEKARNTNRDWAKGPWVTWRGEMSRKTVGHRIAKSIPRSSDKESDRFHNALDRVVSEAVIDGTVTAQASPMPIGGGKLAMLEGLVGSGFDDDDDYQQTQADADGVIETGSTEPADPELSRAQDFVRMIGEAQTAAEVEQVCGNTAIKRQVGKWKMEKPALFDMVDNAAIARLEALKPADAA